MITPSENLRLALIQGHTHWHDREANYNHYEGLIQTLAGSADLILLPEAFPTGFTNDTASQAEPMEGPSLAWMRRVAREKQAIVAGSLLVREEQHVFNRLLWVRPDGGFSTYDKRHLFRMAGEHQHFTAGSRRLVEVVKGWRVCPMICYDLRFPVWSRNRPLADRNSQFGAMEYDLLAFVANWPAVRSHPWLTLLQARAIENLCFVAGVNRAGRDGNGHQYSGDSALIDPLGEIIRQLGDDEECALVELDAAALHQHRQRFPAWMDADDFRMG